LNQQTEKIKCAVILAGGLGERMKPLTNFIPKALTPFESIPIIHHQISQFEKMGLSKVIILTGYLEKKIRDYLINFDFQIEVILLNSPPEYSPAERLLQYKKYIPQNFILVYCDNFISDEKIIRKVLNSNFEIHLVLQKRKSGNIEILHNKKIEIIHKDKIYPDMYVELGYIGVKYKKFFDDLSRVQDLNTFLMQIVKTQEIGFSEIFDTYLSASNIDVYLRQVGRNNIIFLDRDGIINYKPEKRKYITNMKQFKKVQENWDYLVKLSKYGFYFVVITNQPGIATGEVTPEFLQSLHSNIYDEMILSKINILAFYTCPHHWDDKCLCRKPNPGLIQMAKDELGLISNNYLLIGDDQRDVDAAHASGIRGALVNKGNFGLIEEVEYLIKEIYNLSGNVLL